MIVRFFRNVIFITHNNKIFIIFRRRSAKNPTLNQNDNESANVYENYAGPGEVAVAVMANQTHSTQNDKMTKGKESQATAMKKMPNSKKPVLDMTASAASTSTTVPNTTSAGHDVPGDTSFHDDDTVYENTIVNSIVRAQCPINKLAEYIAKVKQLPGGFQQEYNVNKYYTFQGSFL